MNILLKKRLKNIYIFISTRGDQMDPKIDQKGSPSKGMLVWFWPLGPSQRPKSHLDHNLVTKWTPQDPKIQQNTVSSQPHCQITRDFSVETDPQGSSGYLFVQMIVPGPAECAERLE